jgi:hypothetical protein
MYCIHMYITYTKAVRNNHLLSYKRAEHKKRVKEQKNEQWEINIIYKNKREVDEVEAICIDRKRENKSTQEPISRNMNGNEISEMNRRKRIKKRRTEVWWNKEESFGTGR